jgi:hypothetical protein
MGRKGEDCKDEKNGGRKIYFSVLWLQRNESKGNGGQTRKENEDNRHRKAQQRPNPKSLLGDKVDSGIGLSMVHVLESTLEWT